MTMQGYAAMTLVTMAIVVILAGAGKKILGNLVENKGFIGFQVTGWFLVLVLAFNSRVLADYAGFAKSEIDFIIVMLVAFLLLSIGFRFREKTVATAKYGTKAGKAGKKAVDRVRKSETRVEFNGFIGFQVTGCFLVLVLAFNSRVIADYAGFAKSEIDFLVIMLIAFLLLSIGFRFREKTVATAKYGTKAGKAGKKAVDRVRKSETRVEFKE